MNKFLTVALVGLGTACCPLPAPNQCPVEEITFTQHEGCLNDGTFEFCIPADDPEALAAVLAIAPPVQCMNSSGRARCNLETQILCLVSTQGMCASSTAMNDTGWQTVCSLASLPFIEQIVPSWYE